jgi:hypothetical protein
MDSENSLSNYELGLALKAAGTLLKLRALNENAIAAIKRAHKHLEEDSAPDTAIIQDGVTAAVHALKLIGELGYSRHMGMLQAVFEAVVYLDGGAPPTTKITISKE